MFTRWCVAPVALLECGIPPQANVPVPVYKSDPGYEQALWASETAPLLVLLSLVLAAGWIRRDPSWTGRITAGIFGGLVLIWSVWFLLLSAGTVFPDETGGEVTRFGGRRTTPDEALIVRILIAAALCCGVLAVRQLFQASGATSEDQPEAAAEAIEDKHRSSD